MSAPFTIDRSDAKHVLKVAGYLVASIAIAALLQELSSGHVTADWLIKISPIINIALVTLQRYVEGKLVQESNVDVSTSKLPTTDATTE